MSILVVWSLMSKAMRKHAKTSTTIKAPKASALKAARRDRRTKKMSGAQAAEVRVHLDSQAQAIYHANTKGPLSRVNETADDSVQMLTSVMEGL